MAIPQYILDAADVYASIHIHKDQLLFGIDCQSLSKMLKDAFIEGYKTTKKKNITKNKLDVNQQKNFDASWVAYGEKGNKKDAENEWAKISPSIYPIIIAHIKAYVNSREKKYTKNFEKYLKEEIFKTIVLNGNRVVFDPRHFDCRNEYTPLTDGISRRWNPTRNCLEVNSPYLDMMDDGYTSENRPDGATVAWSLYTWKWSSERKEWVKQ